MENILARLGTTWTDVAVVVVAALAIYAWVIIATRVVGLRTFSKMSAFDFAMTVAVGSLVASIAIGSAPLADGAVAIGVLFAAQWFVAKLRRGASFERVVDNAPLLLMYRQRIMDDHLASARLTRDDLRSKLREANVLRYEDVHAVILETTGDVTVLHGAGRFDFGLLEDVRCGDIDPDV